MLGARPSRRILSLVSIFLSAKTVFFASFNIKSIREGKIKGYHEVEYVSENDSIKICHNANSRHSFAYGAVLSAEFIFGKKGVYSIDDVINNLKI